MSDRERFSSVEEQLVAIKTLCKGHGEVKVNFDHAASNWCADAPLKFPDGEPTIAYGDDPSEAIGNLWNRMIADRVMITYPNVQNRYFKWDGIRWVDLSIMEPML